MKTRAAYKCSICGSVEHTARNHGKMYGERKNASQMAQVESKRTCSYCYCPGHNSRTCTARLADEADKLAQKRIVAAQIVGPIQRNWVSVHVAP